MPLARRCPAPRSARALAQLGAGYLASPGHPRRCSAARCHRTRRAAAPSAAPGLCPALPRRPLQADHTLSPPRASTPASLTLHRLLRRPASSHPFSPRASALALAPTSPTGPRPPGNLWTQPGRCLVLPQTHLGPHIDGCRCDGLRMLCIMCKSVFSVEPCITSNNIEMRLFPGVGP